MADPRFGMGVDIEQDILGLLKTLPRMDQTDAGILLRDLYETRFGIFNHIGTSKKRPLASVALHDAEEINENSLLYEAMHSFAKREIKDIFNISFLDFISLPMDWCAMITEIASATAGEKATAKSNHLSEVERQLKEMET